MRTLVLGLGNLLLADEGVGVHAAQALAQAGCPAHVTVLDIGTALFEALPELERADRVVVVDAVQADGAPGSVYRIPMEDMATKPCIASMHGFDLHRLLDMTRRRSPPEVVVVGVEPKRIDWSLELSEPVREAFPTVLETVRSEWNR
ncbi:MAG: hypothetical protein Kow0092_28640 [Deferrisomatales bacterium]